MKVKAKPEVRDHLLDEFDNQSLEPNKVYEVIEIDDAYFRILDEEGEPYLYPKYLFDIVDPTIPAHSIRREYAGDEYHIGPPELSRRGFYEAYFDRDPEARVVFGQFLIAHGLKVKGP